MRRIGTFEQELPCDWVLILPTGCSPANIFVWNFRRHEHGIVQLQVHSTSMYVHTTTTAVFGRMDVGEVHRWKFGIAFEEQASIYNHARILTYFA